MTVMYLPDIEFGVKYVALIEGRVRECFLKAVTLDIHSECDLPYYLLEAAGIKGDVRVSFDVDLKGSCLGRLKEYDSILADSYEDFMEEKFHKYYQLDTEDWDAHDILQELLPNVTFEDRPKMWQWDKDELKPELIRIKWNMWSFDAGGFVTDIPFKDYFETKEACFKSHIAELGLVTFD